MMLTLFDFVFIIMFLSYLKFCLNHSHLLMILLSLEFIVLLNYFLMIVYLSFFEYELFFSMFFLVLSVCEGILGLSVLISMVRVHGNDYFQNVSIL